LYDGTVNDPITGGTRSGIIPAQETATSCSAVPLFWIASYLN
jgi:hypothetical protein